ncbi:uncharacterized protein LOC134224843 isoform X2 [Armigeres subalbatus]|uniref:uncharacterized protein LOC134224843 isoform X2 n=1 Tax=Armigeres subalbatus TaxID=124917 RepID=UPI002ED1187F
MGKKCVVLGCGSRTGDTVSFYGFPNDPGTLTQWLHFCDQVEMREAVQRKDGFKFRHVCSKHFERAAFKNPLIVSLGLKKHAVPTIKTLNPTAVEDNVSDYESQYIELLSSDMTVDTGVVEEQIDYAVYYRTLYENEVAKVEILKKQLTEAKKERRDCLRLSNKRKNALYKKICQIRALKLKLKEKQKLEGNDKMLINAVKTNPVLQESLENGLKNKYGRRYRATRFLATRQKLASTACYRKLRAAKVMCLPHPKTVTNWQSKVQLAPGFNKEILQRMSLKAKTMAEPEKAVAILIDGMAIKGMIDYHAKSDRFHGFPDDGAPKHISGDDELKLATEAVTIMVRSVQSTYKQPLRASISENSEHWCFLEEAKRVLENTLFVPADCFDPETASDEAQKRLTLSQRQPPCIAGYIHNINAIRKLWRIVYDQHGFSTLRMINVCNDPLENEYGKLRRACGTNDAPNAHQFAAALKYSCIEKSLSSDHNSNCIPDNTTNLVDEQCTDESMDVDPLAIDESFLMCRFEPLDKDFELPDLLETNALVYVVGYAVTKLKHVACQDSLKRPYSSDESLDVNYTFCKYKQYLNAAGFIYPNSKALEIGAILLIALKQKFYKFLLECRNGVKMRLKEYVDYEDFKEICYTCFCKFCDILLNTFFNGQTIKMQSIYQRKQRKARIRRNGKARRMDLPIKTAKVKRKKDNFKGYHNVDKTCQEQKKLKRVRAASTCIEDPKCKNARQNESEIEEAGPSAISDKNPDTTTKKIIDPELQRMNVITEQLEMLAAAFPRPIIVRVEKKDCLHIPIKDILDTYAEYTEELTQIFNRYKGYSERHLRSVKDLVNWEEVSSIFTDEQQYAMALFLDEQLVPLDQKGQVDKNRKRVSDEAIKKDNCYRSRSLHYNIWRRQTRGIRM